MSTRVLVTAAGGAGSIEIIKALCAKGYAVLATDCSTYAAGFVFADRGFVVPPASEAAFRGAITNILRDTRPEFIVPLVDEEIPIFHAMRGEDGVPPFRVVAPAEPFCALALDKWLTFQHLRQAEIPTPGTFLAGNTWGARWPAVLKPRDGRGGRGVAYLASERELHTHLALEGGDPDRFIVQEQVRGPEFTVSAVVGLGGRIFAVVPKEVVSKKGITLVGITRRSPAIDVLCRDIQDKLHADGPFNVQLIVDAVSGPQVIEINPRYSTTVALTIAAGVDEVDVVIRDARGEMIGPVAYEPDLIMSRHYAQVYVQEHDWPVRIDGRSVSA